MFLGNSITQMQGQNTKMELGLKQYSCGEIWKLFLIFNISVALSFEIIYMLFFSLQLVLFVQPKRFSNFYWANGTLFGPPVSCVFTRLSEAWLESAGVTFSLNWSVVFASLDHRIYLCAEDVNIYCKCSTFPWNYLHAVL